MLFVPLSVKFNAVGPALGPIQEVEAKLNALHQEQEKKMVELDLVRYASCSLQTLECL